jgi:hypothetical protein
MTNERGQQMTNEQINIAIAEVRGCTDCKIQNVNGKLMYGQSEVTDYCQDLNAMHEAEKTLTNVQHRQYRREIWHSVCEDLSAYEKVKAAERAQFSSTARQRAEAFLRTLGKWGGGGGMSERSPSFKLRLWRTTTTKN